MSFKTIIKQFSYLNITYYISCFFTTRESISNINKDVNVYINAKIIQHQLYKIGCDSFFKEIIARNDDSQMLKNYYMSFN